MTEEELSIQLPKLKERITFDEDIFGDTNTWEQVLKDLLDDSKSIIKGGNVKITVPAFSGMIITKAKEV